MIHTNLHVPVSRLDLAVAAGPLHLRPIYKAVRDHRCMLAVIAQHSPPIEHPPTGMPLIAVVGDDMDAALGPAAFHRPSLRRLVKASSVAAIVSSGPEPEPYLRAATNAVLARENVVIVETRAEKELQWVTFLREANPDLGLFLCTVADEVMQ